MAVSRLPPAETVAWPGSRSMNPVTRSSWVALLTGPSRASSLSGMPTTAWVRA